MRGGVARPLPEGSGRRERTGRDPCAIAYADVSNECEIERLIPGGDALTHLGDGRVALLRGAAPGDRVRVDASRDRRRYVRVERWTLLEGSPQRATPPCPHARECGGCDWMHLGLEAQRDAKRDLVADALRRIGGFEALPEIRWTPSPADLGYRARIRLHIDRLGRVGFHASGSHRLVEVERCLVATRALDRVIGRLRGLADASVLAPFANVEIRGAPDGSVCLFFGRRRGASARGAATREALDRLRADFHVVVEGEPQPETTWQRHPLTASTYLLAPPGAFTQVNWAVNRRLVADVVAGARQRGARSFADLHCGAGNFALPLLAAGLSGVGIDAHADSIRAARRAAAEQGLGGEFVSADVAEHLRGWAEDVRRVDLMLLDPPRSGMATGLDLVARTARHHVALCACDPATGARDLRRLAEHGYRIEALGAYDMFPHTHHVELLAWLVR
jgi:23S rRNA (uracil1939-C5)-methyltransferase